MEAKKAKYFFYFCLVSFTHYFAHSSYEGQAEPAVPITIIIHGTWFPLISSKIHKMDCPYGFTRGQDLDEKNTLGKMARILHKTDPVNFPLDNIYVFGWSGKLSYKEREKAACELFKFILEQTGPIHIITHSHGGNVALNLVPIVQQNRDVKIKIDMLILLACPVQFETEKHVDSPIFKKIFSFYSERDTAQVIDPQGFYHMFGPKSACDKIPFLSKRIFASEKVFQMPVKINNKHLEHNDFLTELFIEKLPEFLTINTQ